MTSIAPDPEAPASLGTKVPRQRPKSLRLADLLLVAFSLLLAFGIAEVALRVAGLSHPLLHDAHPVFGVALIPKARGRYALEGEAVIEINGDGMRDREHAVERAGDTYRVAILGDSYAEALQVPIERTFWWILEKRLEACPALDGKRVEVLNFGVSGYAPAHHELVLRHKVPKYRPDAVLLTVTTGNDISDSSRELRGDGDFPFYQLVDGELVLDERFRASPRYLRRQSFWARAYTHGFSRFRVAQLLHHFLSSRRRSRAEKEQLERREARGEPIVGEPGLNPAVYAPPTNGAWEDAWRVVEAVILKMRDEAASQGAAFFVATLSSSDQVHPDAAVRRRFASDLGVDDLFYPERRLQAALEPRGVPFLALAPLLLRHVEQNPAHLHGFGPTLGRGHWNATGHDLGGRMLATWLCGVLETRSGSATSTTTAASGTP